MGLEVLIFGRGRDGESIFCIHCQYEASFTRLPPFAYFLLLNEYLARYSLSLVATATREGSKVRKHMIM